MKKMLLVDGNLLLFRSFYAAYAVSKEINNLPSHLFFNSLIEVIKQEEPEYIFLGFDAFGKTKRHEKFEQYKAGRISPPISIYEQKKIITELLNLAKIKWFEQIGDEADDLIATLTHKYYKQNEIVIFSEDKDLLQLIDSNISILIKNKKNKSKSYMKINQNNFYDIFQLKPYQIPDFKAIAGDISDNLKGVKGIGDKTAITLLNKYETLENIYENLTELTNNMQNKFIYSKNIAILCKELAILNKNVNLNFEINDIKFNFMNLYEDIFLNRLKKYDLNKIHYKLTNRH